MPGPSVFPSGEPGVSRDFWGSQEGCQGTFRPSGRNRGLPLRRRGEGKERQENLSKETTLCEEGMGSKLWKVFLGKQSQSNQ